MIIGPKGENYWSDLLNHPDRKDGPVPVRAVTQIAF